MFGNLTFTNYFKIEQHYKFIVNEKYIIFSFFFFFLISKIKNQNQKL